MVASTGRLLMTWWGMDVKPYMALVPAQVKTVLETLVWALHMTAEGEYTVVERRNGLTGFIIIAESHIAIEEQREQQMAFVTIASCKPFSQVIARNIITSHIGAVFNEHTMPDRTIE